MGYKDAKSGILKALNSGVFQHEARNDISDKNKLQTAEITVQDVIKLITKSNGNDHTCSPHHVISGIEVHVIKVDGWYIKFYFLEPDTFFISVHQ